MRVLSKIHSLGHFHGDPRWHNILQCRGAILFCDFQQYAGLISGPDSKAKVVLDMEILLTSFCIKITADTKHQINTYAAVKTEAAMEALILAIRPFMND
jgi:RIO-like serine/threonine protein kinase